MKNFEFQMKNEKSAPKMATLSIFHLKFEI